MVIFHSYVSLPEGRPPKNCQIPRRSKVWSLRWALSRSQSAWTSCKIKCRLALCRATEITRSGLRGWDQDLSTFSLSNKHQNKPKTCFRHSYWREHHYLMNTTCDYHFTMDFQANTQYVYDGALPRYQFTGAPSKVIHNLMSLIWPATNMAN